MTTPDKFFVLFIACVLVAWAVWPRKSKLPEPGFFKQPDAMPIPEMRPGDKLRMSEPEGLHVEHGDTIEPYVPVDCTTDEHGAHCVPIETAAQRYLRLQEEWRTTNNAANEEKTPLRIKADDLFRQYMDAEHALIKETQQ